MHIIVKLALLLMTVLHWAMVASIADRIPAGIRLPTRKASCQISKSVKLLSVKSPVMPRSAAIVWAFAAKVMVVAEFPMSKPRVDRFQWSDMRIDALTKTIPVDDWFWPADVRQMHDVPENALEIALSKMGQHPIQIVYASRILEYHQLFRGRTIVLQYLDGSVINDASKKDELAVWIRHIQSEAVQ